MLLAGLLPAHPLSLPCTLARLVPGLPAAGRLPSATTRTATPLLLLLPGEAPKLRPAACRGLSSADLSLLASCCTSAAARLAAAWKLGRRSMLPVAGAAAGGECGLAAAASAAGNASASDSACTVG